MDNIMLENETDLYIVHEALKKNCLFKNKYSYHNDEFRAVLTHLTSGGRSGRSSSRTVGGGRAGGRGAGRISRTLSGRCRSGRRWRSRGRRIRGRLGRHGSRRGLILTFDYDGLKLAKRQSISVCAGKSLAGKILFEGEWVGI